MNRDPPTLRTIWDHVKKPWLWVILPFIIIWWVWSIKSKLVAYVAVWNISSIVTFFQLAATEIASGMSPVKLMAAMGLWVKNTVWPATVAGFWALLGALFPG